jgi:hypothetical protein
MATAEVLRATHSVNDNIKLVLEGAQSMVFSLFRLV